MKNGYEVLKRTTDDRSKCSRSNTDKQRVNNLQTAEEEDAVGTLAGMSWCTGQEELHLVHKVPTKCNPSRPVYQLSHILLGRRELSGTAQFPYAVPHTAGHPSRVSVPIVTLLYNVPLCNHKMVKC